MQATKMRTPFAIQEILGLGVSSAAAVAANYQQAHFNEQQQQQQQVEQQDNTYMQLTKQQQQQQQQQQSQTQLQQQQQQQQPQLNGRPCSRASPTIADAATPIDCNVSCSTAVHSPASTPQRESRSISPDVTRLSAAAAAAAAAAHCQLPVFNPANFYVAASYADHAGQLNAAHHHHMTTLAAAAYLRGFLPPGFSTPHEFRGHFQQHFNNHFVGK